MTNQEATDDDANHPPPPPTRVQPSNVSLQLLIRTRAN